jgi:hypothetical protein
MGESAFFLIVIDEDRKQFTVEGPLVDDQPWNSAIAAARDDGRKVRCCNIGSKSRADAISEWDLERLCRRNQSSGDCSFRFTG